MTTGFGSDNLVFIPEGECLRVIDVAGWREVSLDIAHATVRARTGALVDLEIKIAETRQEEMAGRRRKDDALEAIFAKASLFAESLRSVTELQESFPVHGTFEAPAGFRCWVRVGDAPSESFHAEDYHEAPDIAPRLGSLPVYGSFVPNEEEALEFAFPEEGADAAFEILLPEGSGLVESPLATLDPLPLVDEFCGAAGVSARGRSVNLSTQSEIVLTHVGAVPVRALADNVFVTAYFSIARATHAEVVARLPAARLGALPAMMQREGFLIAGEGNGWHLFRREGDVVHLYQNLPGKETHGTPVMPAFAVAAAAGGSLDPDARAAMLKRIVMALQVAGT